MKPEIAHLQLCERLQQTSVNGIATTCMMHSWWHLHKIASHYSARGVSCVHFPNLVVSQWLSLREVSNKFGTSESTVRRRIIKPIVGDENHTDRNLIRPAPTEVKRNREEGIQAPWKISDALEFENYLDIVKASGKSSEKTSGEGVNAQLVEMLEQELGRKDAVIVGLQEALKAEQELHKANLVLASPRARKLLARSRQSADGLTSQSRRWWPFGRR